MTRPNPTRTLSQAGRWLILMSASVLLAGCLGGAFELGSSAPAPADFQVTAGDSSVTLTWQEDPNVDYWVFVAKGSSVTTDDWVHKSGISYPKAHSPFVVPNLTNGEDYAFTINARIDGGPGGEGAPSQTTKPRLAGGHWNLGAALAGGNLRGASFGPLFVVVGDGGSIHTSKDFNSVTAPLWTQASHPDGASAQQLNAVTYGGVYVAAGQNGSMLRSQDGLSWQAVTSNTSNELLALATNGAGGYVAVGRQGTVVTSIDGSNWAVQTPPTTQDLMGITYGNGLWAAVGKNGTVLLSINGSVWVPATTTSTTQELRGVAMGAVREADGAQKLRIVAVGNDGTLITSDDMGDTWTHRGLAGVNLHAVSFGRQFVAAGDAGSLYTSVDGISWQKQTTGTSASLLAIAQGQTNILSVGASGTNLTAY